MRSRRRGPGATGSGLLVAVALVLAGSTACAEEARPSDPPSAGPQLSREQYLDRANEICRKGTAQIDRLGARVDQDDPVAVRRAVREQVVPNIREQVSDIRALRGPARLERTVTPLLDDTDRLLDYVDEDPARYDDLLFAEVNRQLRLAGLPDCGAS